MLQYSIYIVSWWICTPIHQSTVDVYNFHNISWWTMAVYVYKHWTGVVDFKCFWCMWIIFGYMMSLSVYWIVGHGHEHDLLTPCPAHPLRLLRAISVLWTCWEGGLHKSRTSVEHVRSTFPVFLGPWLTGMNLEMTPLILPPVRPFPLPTTGCRKHCTCCCRCTYIHHMLVPLCESLEWRKKSYVVYACNPPLTHSLKP